MASINAGRVAPIALFVYNRPHHTKATIRALSHNPLAKDTTLYVFSDGPKTPQDERLVDEVRGQVADLESFGSVEVIEQPRNLGLAQSIIQGVSRVIEQHGRVIVFEDDLVSHPATLTYFNTALDRYADAPGVFSISAYSHSPEIMPLPQAYRSDVYAVPRMQCWGWATWADRWAKADFSMPDFDAFNADPALTDAYAFWIGADALRTLRSCMAGALDVWACRWAYYHFKNNALCLCPTRSLIQNIGFDDSGVHCGTSNVVGPVLPAELDLEWQLPDHLSVDPEIFAAFMGVMDGKTKRSLELSAPANRVSKKVRREGDRLKRQLAKALGRKEKKPKPGKVLSDAALAAFSAPATVPLVRLGTEYGGWWFPSEGVGPDTVVVSAGAGEDLSFDVAVAKSFGAQLVLLDPTPRAITHFQALEASVSRNEPLPINNSQEDFYEVTQQDLDRLSFRPWGLWDETTTLRFFPPSNPAHVSHSIDNLADSEGGFDAECVDLAELMRREALARIDILKLDVEGAEFRILQALCASDLRPRFILAEFHAGSDPIEKREMPHTIATLRRLYNCGYRLVKRAGWDFVLERQEAAS